MFKTIAAFALIGATIPANANNCDIVITERAFNVSNSASVLSNIIMCDLKCASSNGPTKARSARHPTPLALMPDRRTRHSV